MQLESAVALSDNLLRMARLKDIPLAIKKVGVFRFGKNVVSQIIEDDCFTLGTSMAYSWLFAIFPFFIFLLGLVPYVVAKIPHAEMQQFDGLLAQFFDQLPTEAGSFLKSTLNDLRSRPRAGLLSLGLVLSLWMASGGMATTMSAITRCYDVKARPIYFQRPMAVMVTVFVVVMVLAVIILLPVATIARTWISNHPDYLAYVGGQWVLILFDLLRHGMALLLLFGALSIMYHFGPPIRQTYHFITPGAVFVVITWLVVGYGFKWYVNNFGNYNATYGAVGGVIILLLVFYLNSLMLLIGAEINSEIDVIVRPASAGTADYRENRDKSSHRKKELAVEAAGSPELEPGQTDRADQTVAGDQAAADQAMGNADQRQP
ncbi:MAG: YihY/virulence factor BrkB family protein [Phycisphaerales bacterium]|nr:YihY/virulence factor BrkB family protein [Phycisphaerales bacterium]